MSNGSFEQPAWLAAAWAEIGQREIAGAASNPRIAGYIRKVGHPRVADDATAWCAAFVGACLEDAGLASTRSLMARSYLGYGAACAQPRIGAIAVLSRTADPAFGHVGFLVGLTDSTVVLLGGNQSDAVTVEAFARSRLLDLRWPEPQSGPISDEPSSPDLSSREPSPSSNGPVPAAFAWSLARILTFEGGFTRDPFDPGGPTNKGITLATYAREVGETLTAESAGRLEAGLKVISDALVTRIYRTRYWTPARCPELPAPIAHFHFDAAVNQGVGGAARMLQEALGVEIDGEIGPITLGAARERPVDATLARYAAIRRRRYRSLHHFWRFGRGWLARVDAALAQARSLERQTPKTPRASQPPPREHPLRDAAHGPLPKPFTKEPSMPDSTLPRPSEHEPIGEGTQSKWWGSSLTIWGALLTAATTVAPAIFAALGVDVPAGLIEKLGRDLVTVVQALGGLMGTIMTIAGRARASTRLERRAVAMRL